MLLGVVVWAIWRLKVRFFPNEEEGGLSQQGITQLFCYEFGVALLGYAFASSSFRQDENRNNSD